MEDPTCFNLAPILSHPKNTQISTGYKFKCQFLDENFANRSTAGRRIKFKEDHRSYRPLTELLQLRKESLKEFRVAYGIRTPAIRAVLLS